MPRPTLAPNAAAQRSRAAGATMETEWIPRKIASPMISSVMTVLWNGLIPAYAPLELPAMWLQ
jgi:hypothetical protein